MANLMPLPKMSFSDSNGRPLVGGKVFFYDAGTSTLKNTYTDASGATPNTNPVILDARGEGSIWLLNGFYKVKLCTQAGAEIWTVDNVSNKGEAVSVKDFGARSNTDSTVAIQAAFNSVTTDASITIPAGKYLISDNITLSGKTDFTLICEGAEFVLAAGITGLSVANCLRLDVIGSLKFSGSATATGFTIAGCEDSSFHGLETRGLLIGGILQPPATAVYGGVGVPTPTDFSGFSGKNCGTGLMVTGEYYNISGAEVKGCSSHGLRIQAGNVGVVGGQYIGNRIGIFIEGSISSNSDHGKIIGATVSHNLAAGIYVKNTLFSYHITGCEVWANIGDGTANGQLTEEGRVTSFGVYLQNCENINMTGNTIARNRVNVGIDGLVTSAVSPNNFISDPARTTSHVKEYGANHSTFGVNAQNNYGHNVYDGALLGGSTKRLELLQTSLSVAHNTFGSVGTTGSRIVSLDGTVSGNVFVDGDSDFITLTSNCPATITLAPAQTFGQQFEVSYLQASVGATKSVTLLGASASTSIMCAGVSLSGTTLTFKENGAYKFIPYGSGDGKWVVVRSGGFEAETAPTLTNAWTNLNAGQFTSAGFFKDSDGMVNLQGALATTGASGSSAFTLPAGYRPAKTVTIPIAAPIGLTAFVQIDTAGLVMPNYGAGATFVSLDSVQFRPL
jgi:hypothetical protein